MPRIIIIVAFIALEPVKCGRRRKEERPESKGGLGREQNGVERGSGPGGSLFTFSEYL